MTFNDPFYFGTAPHDDRDDHDSLRVVIYRADGTPINYEKWEPVDDGAVNRTDESYYGALAAWLILAGLFLIALTVIVNIATQPVATGPQEEQPCPRLSCR